MNPDIRRLAVAIMAIGCALVGVVVICGCGPSSDEVAAKYTEQTARAIIESGWHIAAAIFVAAILRSLLNK